MSDANDEWVEVTTLDDLWEGESLPLTVNGVDLMLVNVGGNIRAFADSCPHLNTPLSTGLFDGEIIQCSAHQWRFNADDGSGINPDSACMRRFDVKIGEDEKVYVNLNKVLQEMKGML